MAQAQTVQGRTSNDGRVPIKVNDAGELFISNAGLIPGEDFDYLSIVNTGTDEDTLTFRLGGVSGTIIRTIVIGYAAGKPKASDDLSYLSWS
jgi:hypothetical protein